MKIMVRSVKIDLHMHSGYSPDSLMPPEKIVSRVEAAGLGCIAITDHNTIEGALEVKKIAPFCVIVGEEIKSLGGEIIGLYLQKSIPNGLTALETVLSIKDQGGLVSIPHPFDYFRRSVISKRALGEILPLVDIVESFNARNTFQKSNIRAAELAVNNNILTTAVSDAHTLVEIGRTYVCVNEFDGSPQGLKDSLSNGRLVTNAINPMIHVLTSSTKIIKRLGIRNW